MKNQNSTELSDHSGLVRLEEVCRLSTLRKSTIFKCIKQGTIPKPIKLLNRINAWKRDEIITWIDSMRSSN